MRTALLALLGIPCTVFFTLAALGGGLFGASRTYFDWVHRSWAKSMLWMAGVRVEADGLENLPANEPVILAVNHQSWIDILVLLASLPVSLRFIANKEIRRVPVFASAMALAGHVFVDRQKRGKAIVAMREAAAEGPWAGRLGEAAGTRTALGSAAWYYRLLKPHAQRVEH